MVPEPRHSFFPKIFIRYFAQVDIHLFVSEINFSPQSETHVDESSSMKYGQLETHIFDPRDL